MLLPFQITRQTMRKIFVKIYYGCSTNPNTHFISKIKLKIKYINKFYLQLLKKNNFF